MSERELSDSMSCLNLTLLRVEAIHSILCFLSAPCFISLVHGIAEEGRWSPIWQHLQGTAAEISQKHSTRGHLHILTSVR